MSITTEIGELNIRGREQLNALIIDYLSFHGFHSSVHAFQSEQKKKKASQASGGGASSVGSSSRTVVTGRAHPTPPAVPSTSLKSKRGAAQSQILRHYHDGDFNAFFTLFDKYVPEEMTYDEDTSLLIFQLHVYFAIHPLHPHCKQPPKLKGIQRKERASLHMGSFREYLQSPSVAGAAHSSRTLPYFGLPFVVNPASHPSFQHLFQEEWIMDLESRLDSVMEQALQLTITAPRIQMLFHQSLITAAIPSMAPAVAAVAAAAPLVPPQVAAAVLTATDDGGAPTGTRESAMTEAPSTRITSANARTARKHPNATAPVTATATAATAAPTVAAAAAGGHRRSISQSQSAPSIPVTTSAGTTTSTTESAPNSPKDSGRGDDGGSFFLTAMPSSSMAAAVSSTSSSSSASPTSSPLTSRVIAVQLDNVPPLPGSNGGNGNGKDTLAAPDTTINDGDKMSVRMNSGPLMSFRERERQQKERATRLAAGGHSSGNNSGASSGDEGHDSKDPVTANTARAHLQKLHRRRTQQKEAATASGGNNNSGITGASRTARVAGTVERLEQKVNARIATGDSPEMHSRELRSKDHSGALSSLNMGVDENGLPISRSVTSQKNHRNAKLLNVKERVMKRQEAAAAAAAAAANNGNGVAANGDTTANDGSVPHRRTSSGKHRNSRSVERTDTFPPVDRRDSTRRSTLPRDSVVTPHNRSKQGNGGGALPAISSATGATTTANGDEDDINTIKPFLGHGSGGVPAGSSGGAPMTRNKLVVSVHDDPSTAAALHRCLTDLYQCAIELYSALEHDSRLIGARHSEDYLTSMRERLAILNREWRTADHLATGAPPTNTTNHTANNNPNHHANSNQGPTPPAPSPPPPHLRMLSSPSPRLLLPSNSEPPSPYRNQLFPMMPRIEIPRTPITPMMNGHTLFSGSPGLHTPNPMQIGSGYMMAPPLQDDDTTSAAGSGAVLHAPISFHGSGTLAGTSSRSLLTSGGMDKKKLTERVLFAPLDYSKISSSLASSPIGSHTCALLQALRWRLNRTRNSQQKRHVLQQYIQADFLSCSGTGATAATGGEQKESKAINPNDDLLSKLLQVSSSYPDARECTARLVNSLASFSLGRAYLLHHPNILSLLFQLCRHDTHDSATRQNCLGALQKLSLRRQPQSRMIAIGVMEWLTNTLLHREYATVISDYSREYGTALLMNLSLRTSGKARCERADMQIFPALLHLLDHDNGQVRTYVNGTLYSLLSRKKLREKAKQLGIDLRLQALRPRSEEQFQRQIDCIIEQLAAATPTDTGRGNGNGGNDTEDPDSSDTETTTTAAGTATTGEKPTTDEDEDEDEEGGDDEPDDEEDELPAERGPKGEALLCAQYLAETTNARTQIQSSQHALDEQSARLSRRTPSMHNHSLLNYGSFASGHGSAGPASPATHHSGGTGSGVPTGFAPFSDSPRMIGAPFPQRAVTPRVRGGRPDSSPFKSADLIARTPLHHSRAAAVAAAATVIHHGHHASVPPNLSSIPQYKFAYNLPHGAAAAAAANVNNMAVPLGHPQHHSIGGGPSSMAMAAAAMGSYPSSSSSSSSSSNMAPRPPIPMHPSTGRPPVYGYSANPASIGSNNGNGNNPSGANPNNGNGNGGIGRAPLVASSRTTTYTSTIGESSTTSSSSSSSLSNSGATQTSTTTTSSSQQPQPSSSPLVPGAVPVSSSNGGVNGSAATNNSVVPITNTNGNGNNNGSAVIGGGRAAHARSLRKIPPPAPAAVTADEQRPQDESLSQYYKAFASRSRVGRTPVSNSVYAHRNEFPQV